MEFSAYCAEGDRQDCQTAAQLRGEMRKLLAGLSGGLVVKDSK
jgi:hypothetical protein